MGGDRWDGQQRGLEFAAVADDVHWGHDLSRKQKARLQLTAAVHRLAREEQLHREVALRAFVSGNG